MTDMSATAAPDQSAVQDETAGPGQTLAAAHAQARHRAEAGELTGARGLLEDALAAGELRIGRDHPALAPLMVDLATIARSLGNVTEAQAQLRRAYGIIVIAGGPDHATSLSIEGRLAAVSHRLGEPTEAYDWHLADVGSRVLGPDHPAVRGARQRLSGAPAATQPWGPKEFATQDGQASVPDPPPSSDEPGDEPGYAPTYTPSAPGVYQRLPQADDVYVVEPPPREYHDVVGRRAMPRRTSPRQRRRTNRGGLALVASLGAAAFIAAAVVAVQLFLPAREPAAGVTAPPASGVTARPSAAPPAAISTAPAPTGVALTDNGGSVALTWTDPGAGLIPFIVAGGRIDATSAPLETVPAGRTTSTIYGLNDRYDYCFTVAAVWSADTIVPSMRTCTHRLSTVSAS